MDHGAFILLPVTQQDMIQQVADQGLDILHALQSKQKDCFRKSTLALEADCQVLASDETSHMKYALMLTKCELATADIQIPKACQLDDSTCVKKLAINPQTWTTYSGYYRDVVTICFSVRYPMEKDQSDLWNDMSQQQVFYSMDHQVGSMFSKMDAFSLLQNQSLSRWQASQDQAIEQWQHSIHRANQSITSLLNSTEYHLYDLKHDILELHTGLSFLFTFARHLMDHGIHPIIVSGLMFLCWILPTSPAFTLIKTLALDDETLD
ncbi:hypothetical protein BC941DRAFT_454453 [Chlamydoabsidia padenii]|nr:hypothetical protein BC941DRAFT_454453 [Chlamydoabsidia padenii]